jgi:hypothetical protein
MPDDHYLSSPSAWASLVVASVPPWAGGLLLVRKFSTINPNEKKASVFAIRATTRLLPDGWHLPEACGSRIVGPIP